MICLVKVCVYLQINKYLIVSRLSEERVQDLTSKKLPLKVLRQDKWHFKFGNTFLLL